MSELVLSTSQLRTPVWNSAFKIIEAPMSYTNKWLNTHGRWYELISSYPVAEEEWKGKFQTIACHLYNKKIMILATAVQVIAYPFSWIFTPLTAIADIFAGVIQATVIACQGASKEEIQSILHKKVIAAPTQQLAYTFNNFVELGPIIRPFALYTALIAPPLSVMVVGQFLLAGLPVSTAMTFLITKVSVTFTSNMIKGAAVPVFIHSMLLGDILYRDAQNMVGNLPKFLIPDGYNIFIEGGALDELGENAFDPEQKYAEFKNQRVETLNFKASIKKSLEVVAEKATRFQKLYDWLESEREPYELFGFKSKDEVNEVILKKFYFEWSLLCHPDKCEKELQQEATILFKMVSAARQDLENSLEKIG